MPMMMPMAQPGTQNQMQPMMMPVMMPMPQAPGSTAPPQMQMMYMPYQPQALFSKQQEKK